MVWSGSKHRGLVRVIPGRKTQIYNGSVVPPAPHIVEFSLNICNNNKWGELLVIQAMSSSNWVIVTSCSLLSVISPHYRDRCRQPCHAYYHKSTRAAWLAVSLSEILLSQAWVRTVLEGALCALACGGKGQSTVKCSGIWQQQSKYRCGLPLPAPSSSLWLPRLQVRVIIPREQLTWQTSDSQTICVLHVEHQDPCVIKQERCNQQPIVATPIPWALSECVWGLCGAAYCWAARRPPPVSRRWADEVCVSRWAAQRAAAGLLLLPNRSRTYWQTADLGPQVLSGQGMHLCLVRVLFWVVWAYELLRETQWPVIRVGVPPASWARPGLSVNKYIDIFP